MPKAVNCVPYVIRLLLMLVSGAHAAARNYAGIRAQKNSRGQNVSSKTIYNILYMIL